MLFFRLKRRNIGLKTALAPMVLWAALLAKNSRKETALFASSPARTKAGASAAIAAANVVITFEMYLQSIKKRSVEN